MPKGKKYDKKRPDPVGLATTIGSNLKIYTRGFPGNQYVSTVGLGDVVEVIGNTTAVLGVFIDIGLAATGQITPGAAAVDIAATGVIALTPPPFDLAVGVGYIELRNPQLAIPAATQTGPYIPAPFPFLQPIYNYHGPN